MLRRIFDDEMDTVIGGFRKLHIEELCNMWSPPVVIKIINSRRSNGLVACMIKNRNIYKILLGKLEGVGTSHETVLLRVPVFQ
jgi:hypothetical protein